MIDPGPAQRPAAASQPLWLRVLMVAALGLALVATALLVISDSARWLRLAVVAALWAALVASFAAARSRREGKLAELRLAEAERTYQLELLREIHARREFEAALAGDAHELTAAAQAAELAAVRETLAELVGAVGALPALTSGDVLVQRLTVSTESTRVRALGGWTGPHADDAAALISADAETVEPVAIAAPVPSEVESEAPAEPQPPAEPPATENIGVEAEAAAEPQPPAEPSATATENIAVEPPGDPEPPAPAPASSPEPSELDSEPVAGTEGPGSEGPRSEGPDSERPDSERPGARPSEHAIPVTELLAAFGEPAPGAVGRRHRRAAD